MTTGREPVLVGVGWADNSSASTSHGGALDLMEVAARAALADARADSLASRIGLVAMPRGTWVSENPTGVLIERLGLSAATRSIVAEVGVPQQTLINRALLGIRSGSIDAALVVGGEARAWAARRRRDGLSNDEPSAPGLPDEVLQPHGQIVSDTEIAARFWDPVQQYAVIESALLHAEGGNVDEIDNLWARFAAVAAGNERAAFGHAPDARTLRSADNGNRLLAYPYRKWHSTQWNVDQAAALLLCSYDVALELGVPRDRMVFPRVALESSHAVPLAARQQLHRWPAMGVLGEAATAWLERPLNEIEHIELYSCFPSAVRVQQRELGLPLDATPTITGGMAFAGGPFNNFTYQATVALVERVRHEPSTMVMMSTVSGLLTKPGLMVWSGEPGPLLIADLAEPATAVRQTKPTVVGYEGPATVVGWTTCGDADDDTFVIAETPTGSRLVARSAHAHVLDELVSSPMIGRTVRIEANTWRWP